MCTYIMNFFLDIDCTSMDINTDQILSRLNFHSPKNTQGRSIEFSLLFNDNLVSNQHWHIEVQRKRSVHIK